jgi:amino acid adenylation domain-containing protein
MTEDTTSMFQGSPQQDEQWRLEPPGPSGRVQALVRLDGPLDADALTAALHRAVDRHESLRTTFAFQPGITIPLQVVNEALEPDWSVPEGPASADGDDVAAAVAREHDRPWDYEHGPLVRGLLLRQAADRHMLVLTLSTLCADTASAALLVAELAHHLGAATEIVEDPLQYADFAAWQLELSDSDDEEAQAARAAWNAFDGARAPAIPFTTAATVPQAPAEVPVELDPSATPELVHAAWHALLGRIGGDTPVVVSFLSSDRRHADLEGSIGAFARPVPISTDIEDGAPFSALLEQVERARSAALELQDYAPARRSAGPSIGFADYSGYRAQAGELSISLERISLSGPPWTLWLSCARGEDPAARIQFDPQSHDRESVERLARELRCLTDAALADRHTPTAALPVLDASAREQILSTFNDTATAAPGRRIHDRFALHASATPARDAVIDEHGSMGYAELDARANQLAHRLRAAGVGPDVTVGLCTDRSIEMVIGLLGILKAGGAYVPLNYEHPPARLQAQLAAAGAPAIVTQEALLSRLPAWEGEIVCLDRDRAELDAEPTTMPEVPLGDEHLAYVIYTSGSTGTPKGVAVTHANLANYVADITARLRADAQPLSFGLITAISTDLGNTSVFGALGSGGTLVLLSPAVAGDGAGLARVLEATPVDVLKITPSHIGALLSGNNAGVLPRRTLVIGGERAPWDLVARIRSISACAVLNHYGPTEATIGCCTFAVPDGPGPYEPASVPIGRPIANTSCYVLDAGMEPVPIGVPGTLYIGGAGVARGYIGQPELTAELFIADPFSSTPGARMYNTGDLARWLPDGTLEFLGRSDDQVKIRGYRVEPAEVEAALRSHPQVGEAVVVAAPAGSGERRLVAYCTTTEPGVEDDLRGHLATVLPEFMLPAVIVTLDAMPRTPSGKIDRLSLPDPASVSESTATPYLAPRTPVEQAIAVIWQQTLGVQRIGVQDDFFDLGGHSLLATQVVAQVRSELAVDLPLHSLFTCPTIELLAAEIVGMMGDSESDEDTASLLAELEGLSDEEAERLLAGGAPQPEGGEQ